MKDEEQYYVDVPPHTVSTDEDSMTFVNVDTFTNQADAFRFATKVFGADKRGRVQIVTPNTLFIPGAYYTSAQIRNKLERTDILVLSFYADDETNAIGVDSWKEVIAPPDLEEVVWEAVCNNVEKDCFPFTTRWCFNGDTHTFTRVYAYENAPDTQFTVHLKPYEPYT